MHDGGRATHGMRGWRGAALGALLSIAVLPAAAIEPELRFERIGVDDGLSQASARAVLADRRGFLWFGTQEGLNRHDGYGIKAYAHDAADPESLADNNVGSLHQDRDGVLWIGTLNGGLNRFDPASGRFTRYQPNPDDPTDPRALPDRWVRTALTDLDGRVWAATGNGLARLDGDRFTVYRHDPADPHSLSHNVLRSLHVDARNRLWIGTEGGGLNRLDPGSERFERYRLGSADDPASLAHDFVFAIASDRSGAIWIGTEGAGLDRLDPDSGRIEVHRPAQGGEALGNAPVTSLRFDRNDQLWIGTRGGGVGVLDPSRQQLRWLRNEPANPHSLSHNTVWSIDEDAAGTIWIGTADSVNRFHPRTRQFGHYRRRDGEPDSLSHDWVRSFHVDAAGTLWVGTQEGLNRWDESARRFQHFRSRWSDAASRKRDHVRAIAANPAGGLWLGSDEGLARFDPGSGEVEHVDLTAPGDAARADRVASLLLDADGSLWVGTHEDGLIHRVEGQPPRRFRRDPNNPRSLAHDQVRAIHRDRRGRLWLGTWGGGLCRLLEPDAEPDAEFDCHRHDPARADSLSNDVVRAIHEDAEGQLWLATQGGGLVRFAPETRSFRVWRRSDGLADDSLYGILGDGRGRLWISTNNGLSRFDPGSGEFRNFSARDGLQGNEFNTGAYLRTADGELLFGGIGGFNRFRPEQIEDDPTPPPVLLTELLLANRPVPLRGRGDGFVIDQPIDVLSSLTLSHRERQISIEFAALSYADPRRNRYAYRLQGFDADWIHTDFRNRRATYTNLPAGDYLLQVRASNAHGVWNETGAQLRLQVLPAPWLSGWAYLGYLVLLAGLVRLLLRWRERRVRQQARALQTLVDERTAELRRSHAELQRASETDPLTGLGNRRLLMRSLRQGQLPGARSARDSGRQALLLLDIDQFKAVNDHHGHAAGDLVLMAVAECIREQCRSGDLAGRWGGEEFLLRIAVDDEHAALRCAERLRRTVAARAVVLDPGRVLQVTCSIGVACLPFEPSQPERLDWERVLTIADAALYLAKHEGRDRVIGFASRGRIDIDFESRLIAVAEGAPAEELVRVLRVGAETRGES